MIKRFASRAAAVLLLIQCITMSPLQAQSLSELVDIAVSAGIEQAQISELQVRAAERGLDDGDVINILRPAINMAEQNLPSEMVFDKAFEGLSKRVPPARMQPVLDNIFTSSLAAAEFVDPWVQRSEVTQMLNRDTGRVDRETFRNEMIKATAKGLSQNFDRAVLEQTLDNVASSRAMQTSRPSGIITAVSILSDLPTAAQQPSETAEMVVSALEGGFEAADLQKLPAAMNMAQRRSQLPAHAVANGLRRLLEGGSPASHVLQNLFNGEVGGGPPGGVPPGLRDGHPGRGNQGNPPGGGPPNN
ncbi:MAG: hypothetical protein LAT84_11215 [Balneolia bacterium]|nr:hypothetical protein [Balneolia bacterium]